MYHLIMLHFLRDLRQPLTIEFVRNFYETKAYTRPLSHDQNPRAIPMELAEGGVCSPRKSLSSKPMWQRNFSHIQCAT